MIRTDNTAESRRFAKKCGAVFGSGGWSSTAFCDESIDWKIDKWYLHLLMTCGRSNMLDFISVTKIIGLMEGQVARCRVRKFPKTFFVLDFELGGNSLVALADRGLAVFYTHELELVASLAQLEHDMPDNLETRQLLLLRYCPWACLSVSERFLKSGDVASAFEWAKRAVPDDDQPNPRINRTVFDTFFNTQHYEDAETFACDRLEANQSDPEMLRALRKLAQRRGDRAEVALLDARIADLPENAPGATFETLIERRKQRESPTGQKPASEGSTHASDMHGSKPPGPERSNTVRRLLGKLLRK